MSNSEIWDLMLVSISLGNGFGTFSGKDTLLFGIVWYCFGIFWDSICCLLLLLVTVERSCVVMSTSMSIHRVKRCFLFCLNELLYNFNRGRLHS